jgi:hypothetical protein
MRYWAYGSVKSPDSDADAQTHAVVASRVRHQPDAHLDHDPQRGLGENAVVVWPEAIVEEAVRLVGLLLVRRGVWICLRVWDASHATSPESSVGEDDVHSAVHHPVVAVGCVAWAGVSGLLVIH